MIVKIAWKNIVYKPFNTLLCVGLLTLGVGIISLLLIMQHQLQEKFKRDLQNIDLVVGAKGSPLQLVLSAVYHLDAPTGNISMKEAKPIMENPMVEEAIPLAYGDSYKGFRIVGTTSNYVDKYTGEITSGKIFSSTMEVTIGADVAAQTGLKIGDNIYGTHGDARSGHVHDDFGYQVVGILGKTNTVLDDLLLTNLESVWQVHSDHPPNPAPIDTLHAMTLDLEHDHDHDHDHDHSHDDHNNEKDHITHPTALANIVADSMDITAILIKYKSKRTVLSMPRLINDQTTLQAVLPALEINRLFYLLGVGISTLKLIAGGIMLMAGFSVFFILYNRLKERKYELALLRSVGYKPSHLFTLLVLEGVILTVLGYLLGWILSRISLQFVNAQAQHDFNWEFESGLVAGEERLLFLTFAIGIFAALIPALQALRMNVSNTLSKL